MKKFLLLLIFLVFSFVGFSQETQWQTVKNTEMAYRIDFPGEATGKSQDVPTEKGSVKMYSYQFQPINDVNLIYMSSFTEYPQSFFLDGISSLEDQTKLLDGSVSGAVTNTKGTLISDEKIVFNGYNGREVAISIGYDAVSYIITMRIVLVNFRIYIAQVIAEKGKEDNLERSRFFNSFELIKVKQ